jgi:hypothetical protein
MIIIIKRPPPNHISLENILFTLCQYVGSDPNTHPNDLKPNAHKIETQALTNTRGSFENTHFQLILKIPSRFIAADETVAPCSRFSNERW